MKSYSTLRTQLAISFGAELANPQKNTRIWFAHFLRGVAAITVLFFHYNFMFFKKNELVSGLSFIKPCLNIHNEPIALALAWLDQNCYVNLGYVGVSLFFLISGFIIPISLENTTLKRFIMNRFFRIMPTYGACFCFTGVLLFLSAALNNYHFPYNFSNWVANIFLLNDIVAMPSIDGVNWTLEIEIKFYAMCVALTLLARKWYIHPTFTSLLLLIIYAGLVCLLGFPSIPNSSSYANQTIVLEFRNIIFMLIGTAFSANLHSKGSSCLASSHIEGKWQITLCLLNFLLSIVICFNFARDLPIVVSYLFALSIFFLCYRFQQKLKYNVVLDKIANISYPLYLCHGLPGYVLLGFLISSGVTPSVAVILTTILALFIASVFHRFIELPSNRFGRLHT